MQYLTALAGRVMRPGFTFRLARHDIQTALPAALRATMAKGFLEAVFHQALRPEFTYPALADSEPWQGKVGDKKTFTRSGLITPSETPITPGNDASTGTYNIEQWSVEMGEYGLAVDTNMLASAMQMASQYVQDVKTLGTHAGQSLNRVARSRLMNAYAGGRTWCTANDADDTTIAVASVAGFTHVTVNGVLTPVSATNPLTVAIAGVANTVTAVNAEALTLTLGTSRADTKGDAVVAANAPVSVRPTGSTAYDLSASNTATLSLFRSAVARLRKMSVPTIDGAFTAFVDHDTVTQLYADNSVGGFLTALTGAVESPVWKSQAIGRIADIDFVPTTEAPTVAAGSTGAVTVHRPLVVGAGALISAPFDGLDTLLTGTGVEGNPNISMVNVAPAVDVALIVRPPADRLQRIVSTAWQWVGDFGVPTDLYASGADAALYKRAVLIEHG